MFNITSCCPGCSGLREWAIENNFLTEREEKIREVPNIQTRLLRDFRADQRWEMRPGDMLYLPPRIPHRGSLTAATAATAAATTTITTATQADSFIYLLMQ